MKHSGADNMGQPSVEYRLEENGRFVVENYNWARPFSNFLPGIGGPWGIPTWVFYVSRGQCVSSFGARSKDGAILEFHSFNKALQFVGDLGFRTFIKTGSALYEPFRKTKDPSVTQTLVVSSEEVEVREVNPRAGFEVSVRYFPLVGETVPALVRGLAG